MSLVVRRSIATMLLHQEFENVDTRHVGYLMMLFVVRLDEYAVGFDQAITRIAGIVPTSSTSAFSRSTAASYSLSLRNPRDF